MNIFPLEYRSNGESTSSWVARIASSHCDQHVNKQLSEIRQMLNTNRNLCGLPAATKSTAYANHPCTKWARETQGNAIFMHDLAIALNDSGMERSGRVDNHKDLTTIQNNSLHLINDNDLCMTAFCMAMPDALMRKFKDDPIAGYRAYYCLNKSWFARKDLKNAGMYIAYPSSWKSVGEPEWFSRTTLKRAVVGGLVVGWQGSKKVVLTKDMISNYNDIVDIES